MQKINFPGAGSSGGEDGVSTTEYVVMLVLIAIAVASFGTGVGGSVTNVFGDLMTALSV